MSKSETTEPRRRYETLRLAQWAIIDAVTAAGHIASRAADCFEGDDSFEAFCAVREAIGKLAGGPEMRAVRDAMNQARMELKP